MPRRRDERARVLGPTWLKSRQRYRVTTLDPGAAEAASRKRDRYFVVEEEANDYRDVKAKELTRLAGTTVGQALEEFRQYLPERGNKPASDKETMRRLGLFFKPAMKVQVARLRPERGVELYAAFREGKAVDYHRDALSAARWFMGWCVERGMITDSPLAKVKGVGRKNKGKPQLTGDETKKWWALCMAKAARRDSPAAVRDANAALALMMLLSMALRQSDVLKRTVREVDMDATVLRVTNGKTAKSNRPRLIPRRLRAFLREITTGRPSSELLFGHRTAGWLCRAQERFCKQAGVPYVCPHGLKGTAGTVAAEMGVLADKIADHLSHEDASVTGQHYVDLGIVDSVQASRAIEVLFPVPNPVPDASDGLQLNDKN